MANNLRKRSPQEIADMKEWLAAGATLQEIGALYRGITRERVRQLIGNTGRKPHWKQLPKMHKNQQRIAGLVRDGKTDEEIAVELELAHWYVGKLRNQASLKPNLPPKKHTRCSCIEAAWQWDILFGYTPSATDWNPPLAISHGHPERAQRFHYFREAFGCPYTSQVQGLFDGSWSAFIHATGLPLPPIGGRAHGRWRTGNLSIDGFSGVWSDESIVEKAIEWEALFHEWPRVSDWHLHKSRTGNEERLRRFQQVNPPSYSTVRSHWVSFGVMLEEAKRLKKAREEAGRLAS